MTVRRRIAALMAAVMLLTGCAIAEEAVPAETRVPVYAPADMAAEEMRAFVEAMFAAAAGTNAETEQWLREDMTEEDIAARNAENAEYRTRTLPWLIAAFAPEPAAEEEALLHETPQPTAEPTEVPTHAAETTAEPVPVYTAADGYEAFAETESGREYRALMNGMGCGDMETGLLLAREICGMWIEQVDHEKLSEMNADYRGWIYAPGTQIDYPIVQSEDNSHYLKRLFNGKRNSAGTLFIDYRNLPDFQDPNTLVYGHHMRNDSMFGTLTDYAEQTYFEGHPVMLMMTEDEVFLLEIFAGYTTSDEDHCYDIAISDEEDMAAFIDEAARKSDFVSGTPVMTTDRLVTLSTCAYAFKDARYILIGRIAATGSGEKETGTDEDMR